MSVNDETVVQSVSPVVLKRDAIADFLLLANAGVALIAYAWVLTVVMRLL